MIEFANRAALAANSVTAAQTAALCTAWQHELLHSIPLVRAMQVRLQAFDGTTCTLSAPLAPNVNDKGCAFGGSLSSVLTLSGWGLIALRLGEEGMDYDVYVQDSTARYLMPVWQDFSAQALLADGEDWDIFVQTLHNRGRARLRTHSRIRLDDGRDAATLEARFVAMRRDPKPA